MVNGIVIDSSEALCISPAFKTSMPVNMKLYINSVAIATTTFTISKSDICMLHALIDIFKLFPPFPPSPSSPFPFSSPSRSPFLLPGPSTPSIQFPITMELMLLLQIVTTYCSGMVVPSPSLGVLLSYSLQLLLLAI